MDENTLEYQAGIYLKQLGWKLAVAESCTGGLVCDRISNVPGCSAYFLGGVTAYAYSIKMSCLGVRQETLELHGAVSKETVLEMAHGIRRIFSADISLAISGIAGPDGGTPEKPVGLTWIALSANGYEQAWNFTWHGDRIENKAQSAQQALQLLVDYLKSLTRLKHAEVIEVTSRFNKKGELKPLEFTWQERRIRIGDVGRSWVDPSGKHILVMDHAGQTYELIFNPEKGLWYLRRP